MQCKLKVNNQVSCFPHESPKHRTVKKCKTGTQIDWPQRSQLFQCLVQFQKRVANKLQPSWYRTFALLNPKSGTLSQSLSKWSWKSLFCLCRNCAVITRIVFDAVFWDMASLDATFIKICETLCKSSSLWSFKQQEFLFSIVFFCVTKFTTKSRKNGTNLTLWVNFAEEHKIFWQIVW